jgi:hypothetical protein
MFDAIEPRRISHCAYLEITKMTDTGFDIELEREMKLREVISLNEVARIRNVSVDTVRRTMADKIIQLSPRRRGMRRSDAYA